MKTQTERILTLCPSFLFLLCDLPVHSHGRLLPGQVSTPWLLEWGSVSLCHERSDWKMPQSSSVHSKASHAGWLLWPFETTLIFFGNILAFWHQITGMILSLSCPRPKISQLFKGTWFLLVRQGSWGPQPESSWCSLLLSYYQHEEQTWLIKC